MPVPYVRIQDAPCIAYGGTHPDVGHHFFPVSFVKKYIDYLMLHKMNYFHWHLTEEQGQRIEIKKYSRLTQVGAWRNGTIIGHYPDTDKDSVHYGGYYTHGEVKEAVKYAAKSNRNRDSFDKRMQVQRKSYGLWGVHYSKAFF